jgi:hypothetical protein
MFKLVCEGFRMAIRLLLSPKTLRWIPYILNEGIAPVRRLVRLKYIEAHNSREVKSFLDRGEPITFITSFPRSGNTWMRYLLSDVFLQNRGIDTTTRLVVHPDEIIADFYCSLVARRNPTVPTPGVLLKIHDSFDQLRGRFWGQSPQARLSFQRCRHLYLYRSPEDALVSLYHHHLREKMVLEKRGLRGDHLEINAFCREALPGWIKHVSGYLAAAESGVPIYFACYDQLLADPQKSLGGVLQWLGAPYSALMVERATGNMQFDKLKATDARDIGQTGCNGAGSAHLDSATIELIRSGTAHLIVQANRRAGWIPAERGTTLAPGEFSPGRQMRNGNSRLEAMAPKSRVA